MKINLFKGQTVEINLGSEECKLVVNKKVFTEKIRALDVALCGERYDKKFKNSFIRNVYKRSIGVGANKYKMCINYSFEA